MRNEVFNRLAKQETDRMLDVMCKKSSDYAKDDDKLFNFKQAGQIDNVSPIEALRGMWLKHRASIQQGLDEILADKKPRPREWWIEKLTDDRNYNLLLFAQLEEQYFIPDGTSPGYGSKKEYTHFCECVTLDFPPGTWSSVICGWCGGIRPIEDNKPEEFEGFTIKLLDRSGCGWVAVCNDNWHLWKNLTIQPTTGYSKFCDTIHRPPKRGEALGYYKTKAEARATIRAYKAKPVFVVKFYKGMCEMEGGWYARTTKNEYLHKNLTLHHADTGWTHSHTFGNAPGYYPTKEIAEAYVKAYEEKHNVGR